MMYLSVLIISVDMPQYCKANPCNSSQPQQLWQLLHVSGEHLIIIRKNVLTY